MPHYGNGIEAKVGDQVTGHLYNTPGIVAGVITSITPSVDSCNAMVRYIVAKPYFPTETEGASAIPTMAVAPIQPSVVRTLNHHSEGPEVALYVCEDYCAINELTKVG
jgi:hypothetical protein